MKFWSSDKRRRKLEELHLFHYTGHSMQVGYVKLHFNWFQNRTDPLLSPYCYNYVAVIFSKLFDYSRLIYVILLTYSAYVGTAKHKATKVTYYLAPDFHKRVIEALYLTKKCVTLRGFYYIRINKLMCQNSHDLRIRSKITVVETTKCQTHTASLQQPTSQYSPSQHNHTNPQASNARKIKLVLRSSTHAHHRIHSMFDV